MHTPPRILVVDDNEINRDIIVSRLQAHGYATLQAEDGEEGVGEDVGGERADEQHHARPCTGRPPRVAGGGVG